MKNTKNREQGELLPFVEEFYSVQGEGFHSGKAAYFIRLAGCNVGCRWCDAKVTWNKKNALLVEADEIVAHVKAASAKSVVITGGEPLLHPLEYLTSKLREAGIEILLETSGSSPLSGEFDWICLSPKRWSPPLEELYSAASEIKVIIKSEEDFEWAELCASRVDSRVRLFLQPEWNHYKQITPLIVEYVKNNPKWCISIQNHKFMNIP